jgi:ribosomal protein S18 acetylase RimI-like enzyme
MSNLRILIDTNILIALEDPGQTEPLAAEFNRRCFAGGIPIHVHPATVADFSRDPNKYRQSISASRLRKYPCLASIPLPSQQELATSFGPIRTENDRDDVSLLYALSINAVDILVSQDIGLHKRVRNHALEERVLTLADAVAWLRSLQDPIDDGLPQVADLPAYSLCIDDPIFASLRTDYDDFTDWWIKKCIPEHRPCWVIRGASGLISGLIVRKSENGDVLGLNARQKVLKLCTFKVASDAQGHKIGELLLRKALWHAQNNQYDGIYLTLFEKQIALIDLLLRYGFSESGRTTRGELVISRSISREKLAVREHANLAELARMNYPRFTIQLPVSFFAIPIQWNFHRQLFPEHARLTPMPLFDDDSIDLRSAGRRPGNTIRKVYICRAYNKSMKAGDVLFFYQSKDTSALHSQCLTTVGIVEQVRRAADYRELSRLTAGRSVFSESDLTSLIERSPGEITVIDFLLIRHLSPALNIDRLIEKGVVRAPPQSITSIPRAALGALLPSMQFGFDL